MTLEKIIAGLQEPIETKEDTKLDRQAVGEVIQSLNRPLIPAEWTQNKTDKKETED